MAQTCNSFSSYISPPPSLPSECSDDNYNCDPDDFFGYQPFSSIEEDLANIASYTSMEDLSIFKQDIKIEIRNSDCMWPALNTAPVALSTSASSSYSDSMTTAVPLAAVTGGNAQSHAPAPTVVVASKSTRGTWPQPQQLSAAEIKSEPQDDYEQQLQHHSILNSGRMQTNQSQASYQPESLKHIPPGTSLLRKSNTQQLQQQQQQKKLQLQKPLQNKMLVGGRDRLLTSTSNGEGSARVLCMRPDTPHSLDDDVAPVFKHDVDLSACLMGSNNIPLTADHAHMINHITQELQDTSKDQIDVPLLGRGANSLSEVLDVIDKDTDSCYAGSNSTGSHIRGSVDSDSEEEGEEDESTGYGSSASTLDDSADLPAELSEDALNTGGGGGGGGHHSHHYQHSYLHSDHSYTRCKDGMDDLGHTTLDTPSDSDEEIDVVNICDKKLPTNPSDKDRRVLQTKVAHKISSARIVKTANGVKTIPGRRCSYELPYTPASSSPVKSVSNSSYPSPASTPYTNQYSNSKYVPINVINGNPRKRLGGVPTLSGSVLDDVEYHLPPSKKNRVKKSKLQQQVSLHVTSSMVSPPSSAAAAVKRDFSMDETADTIEKRNLHNDMERQRRIGLKNLFEELKKQIPSIKDKERAPKVNILREAAKLCDALTREEQYLNEQKTTLKLQLRKRQETLARLRAAQRD